MDDLLPLVDVEWVEPALHAEAREAMLAGGQRGISLVDWTSFLVMRRRGIGTAFTLDVDGPAPRPEGFRVTPLFRDAVEQVSQALAGAMAA